MPRARPRFFACASAKGRLGTRQAVTTQPTHRRQRSPANVDVGSGISSALGPSAALETLAPMGPRIVATGERSEPVEAFSTPSKPRKGRRSSSTANPSARAAFLRPCRGGVVKTTLSTGFAALTRGYSPGPLRGPCPELAYRALVLAAIGPFGALAKPCNAAQPPICSTWTGNRGLSSSTSMMW